MPEMDERFNCTEDAIEHIIRISSVIIDKAKVICPSTSVSDVPGYALEICRKVLIQAETLVIVARKREDYNTLCALVRILADNISIINLVYNGDDEEERIMRHLLYVLDGVSERFALLEERQVVYDGKIPIETFEALSAQIKGARDNAYNCKEFCISAIKARQYYTTYQKEIDILIEKKNWKYKTLDKPKESYSWKEMYNLLNLREAGEMFSYFSQYVHGLSISNIALNDTDDFDAPLSFTVCLLGHLFGFLRKVYEPYIGEYTWDDIYKMAPELFEK